MVSFRLLGGFRLTRRIEVERQYVGAEDGGKKQADDAERLKITHGQPFVMWKQISNYETKCSNTASWNLLRLLVRSCPFVTTAGKA